MSLRGRRFGVHVAIPSNSTSKLARYTGSLENIPLSLENKLLIYKTVLKPVWMYGIEIWGCASKSNKAVIQRYQSKLLRFITKRPTVCLQSNPPFLPTHPACPHGLPGTDSYPSHCPGLAPKPSHRTTSAPAKQQALKTKMDI